MQSTPFRGVVYLTTCSADPDPGKTIMRIRIQEKQCGSGFKVFNNLTNFSVRSFVVSLLPVYIFMIQYIDKMWHQSGKTKCVHSGVKRYTQKDVFSPRVAIFFFYHFFIPWIRIQGVDFNGDPSWSGYPSLLKTPASRFLNSYVDLLVLRWWDDTRVFNIWYVPTYLYHCMYWNALSLSPFSYAAVSW